MHIRNLGGCGLRVSAVGLGCNNFGQRTDLAKLEAFAKARGHSMLELAFSWLASRPQVSSVIAGATRVEQIEQNVKAIDWQLSAEDIAEIDRITLG
jgi:aryl-alcohol dehydrogenase-like predicted oxidoreductase